jgi:Helix-turn-helix domain
MRHTTFRFALDPTPAQERSLMRHAGASRFAYNQALQLMTDALAACRIDPSVPVPWSGFDLINAFNAWKKTEAAGRVFAVARDGTTTKQVTGLAWRHQVAAQVFEEAAVDLSRALSAYTESRTGDRKGPRVGFPRRKRKESCRDSFRLRNRRNQGGSFRIRVGQGHPRSVTLPTIGTIRVHDDTRHLRRLLRPVAQTDPDGQSVVALDRVPRQARVTGTRTTDVYRRNMLESQTCGGASCTRSQASLPRPTPGWPLKTLLLPTSQATSVSPAL